MKKRTAFIGAISSLIPLGKSLLIKTSFVLSTVGIGISQNQKIYAFPIDYPSFNSCAEYKYKNKQSILEPLENGIKMVTTAEVKVLSDYRQDVIEAISKADAKAKSTLNLMNLQAESDTTMDFGNASNKEELNQLKRKLSGTMSDTKNSMRKLNSIIKLSECYEPYQFVRVTFGIKPETIKHFESNPEGFKN